MVRQHLTFILNENIFAIPIEVAKEVLEYKSITYVPNMPEFMLGMISLRGNAVPVMDMKQRMFQKFLTQTQDTAILILELGEGIIVGVMVDAVLEVMDIEEGDVQAPPRSGLATSCNPKFITGLIEVQSDSFIIFLEIQQIFSFEISELHEQVTVLNKVEQSSAIEPAATAEPHLLELPPEVMQAGTPPPSDKGQGQSL